MKQEIPKINSQLNFRVLFIILKQYWYILPLLLLLSLSIAFLYLRYTIPIYTATTTIQMAEDESSSVTAATLSNNLNIATDRENTSIISIFQSRFFLEKTLAELNLQTEYYQQGKVIDTEVYPNNFFQVLFDTSHQQPIGVKIYIDFLEKNVIKIYTKKKETSHPFSYQTTISNANVKLTSPYFSFEFRLNTSLDNLVGQTYYVIYRTQESINEAYIRNISIAPSAVHKNGIAISFQHHNANKACSITNDIIKLFFDYYNEYKQLKYSNVIGYIDEQLEFWENEVQDKETDLNIYKKSNNLQLPQDELLVNIQADAEEIGQRIELISQKEMKLDAILQSFNTEKDPYKLLAKMIGNDVGGNLSHYIDKIQNLLLEKENLQYNYTGNSGRIKNIDHQIDVQINALKEMIHANIESLHNEKNILSNKLAKYKAAISVQEDFSTTIELTKLQHLKNISNTYYERLLDLRVNYSILKVRTATPFLILQAATMNNMEHTPVKSTVYLMAILVSILLFVLIFVGKYLFYTYIDSKNDVTNYVNIPHLGNIPYVPNMNSSVLLVDKDPFSSISETFRAIRANLNFMDSSEGTKVVAVTSTIAGEGKTFILVNIAAIFAYSGKKTIVLDFDMRRPKIHKAFSTEEHHCYNVKGISNILIGKEKWQDCVHATRLENLFFISAGSIPPNPSELILSQQTKDLIEELKQHYDYICIDNPPVGLVTDAIFALSIANYPIYVFKQHYSLIPFVEELDNLYEKSNIKQISFILNAVEMKNRSRYHYRYRYNYRYRYRYNEGYKYENEYVRSYKPKKEHQDDIQDMSRKRLRKIRFKSLFKKRKR